MPSDRTTPATIDDYIRAQPRDVQPILRKIRSVVRQAAPDASEVISYRIPALRQRGIVVYYAAFKRHIGFYPPVSGDRALEKAIARYAGPKGNLQFPLDEEIPYELIARITRYRAKQDAAKSASGRGGRASAKRLMKKRPVKRAPSPSDRIDARIAELDDWRGELLSRLRTLIHEADPDVVEEWKWRGVPVWYHDGIICTGETYQNVVKMTFAKGASLKDPAGLFNASLDGNTRRAIDFHEGDAVNARALTSLIRAAVALNTSTASAAPRPRRARG